MRKMVIAATLLIATFLTSTAHAIPMIAVTTCVSAISGGYTCWSELTGKQFHCTGWDGRSPGTATNCT